MEVGGSIVNTIELNFLWFLTGKYYYNGLNN